MLFFPITYIQHAYFIPEGDVRSFLGNNAGWSLQQQRFTELL